MTRFFIPADQFGATSVAITGEDAHHLVKVVRQTIGDEVIVLNGKGQEYRAEISEIRGDAVLAMLIEPLRRSVEPQLQITLIQGMPKGEKFEWILQKNTEIGVTKFMPTITERSAIKLDASARVKKGERWRKIIKEAAEQSGRQLIPELEPVQDLPKLLRQLPAGLLLIPWEGETERSIKEVLRAQTVAPSHVTVMIGPEGGFSLNEINQAQAAGAIPVTLGPRILRTETAGLAVSSILLYHFDEMGK